MIKRRRSTDKEDASIAAEASTEPEFAKATRTTSLDCFKLVRLLFVVRPRIQSKSRDVWHRDCEAERDRVAKKGASSEATATASVKK